MGAVFNFGKQGDAPTIYSNFFFFFGRIEFVAQAAPGKGIISSLILISDDMDEIDWEFIGVNTTHAETNYFGKGVLNYGVAQYVPVANPQTGFHTYAIDWSATELVWSIDGNVVRNLTAAQAGNEFPQTPMKVSLGLWDGGDASKQAPGTVQWAGG
ncbi:concanavalin A-like lectin/glucanase domain-containing protein, partial [Usnea florida]